MNNRIYRWLDLAVSGIRFRPDREAVRAELRAHIQDRTADFMRIFPDMDEQEAANRALDAMGDPEELKISLAKIHTPWLGWLWQASRVLAAITLALALLLCGTRALGNWYDLLETRIFAQKGGADWRYVRDCYQSGIDPWRADGPYPDRNTENIRTPLAALRPEGSVRAGGYRFRMERAGLFHFQSDRDDPGEWWLFVELRALGLPWEPVAQGALWQLHAVDSAGNRYASSHEVYNLRLERQGYVMISSDSSAGLEQSFDLQIFDIAPGAEWIRLDYNYMGTRWSLTIPLVVEGGE